MAEWAFTPNETVSSILPGYTKNPYALDRVTAGSSGGTAASRRRQLRRGRSRQRHRQLHPRAVIAPGAGRHPLDDGADEPGGRDAAQPARRHRRADGAHGRRRGQRCSRSWSAAIRPIRSRPRPRRTCRRTIPRRSCATGSKGARIGVLRFAYERESHRSRDRAGVHARGGRPAARRARRSSTPASSTASSEIRRPQGMGPCMGFKYDINRYLRRRTATRVPVKSLRRS